MLIEIFLKVLIILLSINLWLIIGYILVEFFDNLEEEEEIEYNQLTFMSITWPLFILISTIQHFRERRNQNG